MKKNAKRIVALLLVSGCLIAACVGCAKKEPLAGTAPNDILTFTPNADNRPVIHIGTQYYSPDETLVQVMQQKYPEYLFVLDYSAAAGAYSAKGLLESLVQNAEYYDLIISGGLSDFDLQKTEICVDLSGERFLDDYLLSALNNVSIDGHIYMVPGTSTMLGIAYNADMFAAHGWEIPETVDEFFALCKQIKSEGVEPFSACFKYEGAVCRLLTMMNYASLFQTDKGLQWQNDVQTGAAHYKDFFEPVYATAKRLNDEGVLTADTFTASLTKQRKAFWEGEYAMIDYDSTIYTYAEAEGATFELGIMPYPSQQAGNAGFAISPEYYFSIPKAVEQNPERLAFVKELLGFISSPEGQEAMLSDSLRISNVRDVKLSDNAASKYAEEAYARGNLYPIISFDRASSVPFLTIQKAATEMIFAGGSVDEAIAYTDAEVQAALASEPTEENYEVIAQAEKAFTMLETSYYIADQFKKLTGADVGMMINGGFFRSNLAHISKGDVTTDMRRFVMKGVGTEDYLTTYTLTGAQIRALLEHPIVNGDEIDAFVASSGLRIKYAPWNARGSRMLSEVTLENGTPLDDDALYTVAAWAGAIDAGYITETVQSYDALGTLADVMEASFRADGSIAPDIAKRVTLVWPEAR